MQFKKERRIMANTSTNKKQIKRKPIDFIMLVTILLLLALGIVMVLSASSPTALAEDRK